MTCNTFLHDVLSCGKVIPNKIKTRLKTTGTHQSMFGTCILQTCITVLQAIVLAYFKSYHNSTA